MYLNEVTTLQIVKQQYRNKLSVMLAPTLLNLLFLQAIGMFWSFFFPYTINTGNRTHYLTVDSYTGSAPMILTLVYLAYIALTLACKSERNQDFIFTANRLTGDLTNILFLMTFAVFGTVMSHLSMIMFRMFIYISSGSALIEGSFLLSPAELGLSWLLAFGYTILAIGLCYAVSSLIGAYPLPWLGVVLVYCLAIGPLESHFSLFSSMIEFFSAEISTPILIVRLLVTGFGALLLSILINHRVEVRQ